MDPSLPNAQLVAGLRRGDAQVFDQVYAQYAPRLYGFLVRLTRSAALAEDLAQETWLRFASRARDLPADSQLGPFLFSIARNLFRTQHRRHVFRRAGLQALWHVLSGYRQASNPLEQLAANEIGSQLEAALARLPVAQREVLLLVAVEQLEPAQAARVLGVSAELVRKRLSRARAELQKHLEREQSALTLASRTEGEP